MQSPRAEQGLRFTSEEHFLQIDLFTLWFLLIGVLLIGMALAGTLVKRLPLTTSLLYLGIGVILGPHVSGLLRVDPVADSAIVERLAEVAVIVSLFTAGLKLRVPASDRRWLIPVRLATTSMALTVAMVAAACVYLLQLPLGVGIVLGAILAPTDPVLASDVQVEHPFDTNPLRFALTGEASLNDGTAFPFLMLGLAILGLDSAAFSAWRWLGVDVLWAVTGAIVIGGILGTLVGNFVLYLRRTHREAVGLDDFLALGLIALAYGAAVACHAYGFLSVFAAGLALRRIERVESKPGRHRKDRIARCRRSVSRGPGHGSRARAGVHGASRPGVQRTDRADRRACRGRHRGRDVVDRQAGRRIAVVRAAAVPDHQARVDIPRARWIGIDSPRAPPDRVVRHPRHRFRLLLDVCDQSRAAGRRG